MRKGFVLGWCFCLLLISSPALSEETPANWARLGLAAGFSTGGTGWITDRLEQGWMISATYDRVMTKRWAWETGVSLLRSPVDTEESPLSDQEVFSDTLGLRMSARGKIAASKKISLYGDAGLGFYQSNLLANKTQKDSATGYGTPLGICAEFKFPSRFTLGLRVSYLPLFMQEEGASFNSMTIEILAGTSWGKFQPRTPKPKDKPQEP